MNRRIGFRLGFSLVEVTIALGVAALCLLAVFGLLPIGVQTNRAATAETAAGSILSSVTADLRSTPKVNTTSTQFAISFGTATTLYFDGEGRFSSTLDANSRYRVTITFPASPTGAFAPTYAHLRVSWPAQATVGNSSGSVETLAAFDRH
jgi:uncharacterized protein (TIGR02598 family)